MAVRKAVMSSINKLPLDMVIELKRRLRAGSFEQRELIKWLKEHDHNITKSALSRFAVKLRNEDELLGHDREFMAKQGADVVALFEELAHLKAREAEILAQLQTIMIAIKQ